MTKLTRDESCYGCRTFNETEKDCRLSRHFKGCPCSQCLIKSMCAQGCDDYHKYSSRETERDMRFPE